MLHVLFYKGKITLIKSPNFFRAVIAAKGIIEKEEGKEIIPGVEKNGKIFFRPKLGPNHTGASVAILVKAGQG